MRYSEDRIKNLAWTIHDRLYLDEDVDYTDEELALEKVKEIMLKFFKKEDEIDDLVIKKILSLQRKVQPGSQEWGILYQRYFEEEMRKHGL